MHTACDYLNCTNLPIVNTTRAQSIKDRPFGVLSAVRDSTVSASSPKDVEPNLSVYRVQAIDSSYNKLLCEVARDLTSGMAADEFGLDVPLMLGDLKSIRCWVIRPAHFVTNERTKQQTNQLTAVYEDNILID